MSVCRPATDFEADRIWPAVRAARVFDDAERFRSFREAGPWRVRVSDSGEACVLEAWREHLDVLAIRGVWCSERRLAVMLDDARALALAHGFSRILSPLLPESLLRPYLRAGMSPFERVVALQATPAHIVRTACPDTVGLRRAMPDDLPALLSVDAECFAEFWRYGPLEIGRAIDQDRLVVAHVAEQVVGYTLSTVSRGVATLARLAVAPHLRRRGIGAALLGDVADYAERNGATQVALCTQLDNMASRALYARSGIAEVEELYAFAICDVAAKGSDCS